MVIPPIEEKDSFRSLLYTTIPYKPAQHNHPVHAVNVEVQLFQNKIYSLAFDIIEDAQHAIDDTAWMLFYTQ